MDFQEKKKAVFLYLSAGSSPAEKQALFYKYCSEYNV